MLKRSKRIERLCVDRHGIGMNLAENLRSEFRSRAEGDVFTFVKRAKGLARNWDAQVPRRPRGLQAALCDLAAAGAKAMSRRMSQLSLWLPEPNLTLRSYHIPVARRSRLPVRRDGP